MLAVNERPNPKVFPILVDLSSHYPLPRLYMVRAKQYGVPPVLQETLKVKQSSRIAEMERGSQIRPPLTTINQKAYLPIFNSFKNATIALFNSEFCSLLNFPCRPPFTVMNSVFTPASRNFLCRSTDC